jgi:hypothetical protein
LVNKGTITEKGNHMTDKKRWTVRGIRQETLDKLAIVRENSEGSFGEFVNEAVASWYESLPEVDPGESDDEAA